MRMIADRSGREEQRRASAASVAQRQNAASVEHGSIHRGESATRGLEQLANRSAQARSTASYQALLNAAPRVLMLEKTASAIQRERRAEEAEKAPPRKMKVREEVSSHEPGVVQRTLWQWDATSARWESTFPTNKQPPLVTGSDGDFYDDETSTLYDQQGQSRRLPLTSAMTSLSSNDQKRLSSPSSTTSSMTDEQQSLSSLFSNSQKLFQQPLSFSPLTSTTSFMTGQQQALSSLFSNPYGNSQELFQQLLSFSPLTSTTSFMTDQQQPPSSSFSNPYGNSQELFQQPLSLTPLSFSPSFMTSKQKALTSSTLVSSGKYSKVKRKGKERALTPYAKPTRTKRNKYGPGQHGYRKSEQKRLSGKFGIRVRGESHESEHAVGFEPINQTSGLKRGSKDERARRLENFAAAYQEVKELHRANIGTGNHSHPDASGFNSAGYRDTQRSLIKSGDVSSAVQINQLTYGFDRRFRKMNSTREGKAANDSYAEMVRNMNALTYAQGSEDVTVVVDKTQREEMLAARQIAQMGPDRKLGDALKLLGLDKDAKK